jgi:hypothetical protein
MSHSAICGRSLAGNTATLLDVATEAPPGQPAAISFRSRLPAFRIRNRKKPDEIRTTIHKALNISHLHHISLFPVVRRTRKTSTFLVQRGGGCSISGTQTKSNNNRDTEYYKKGGGYLQPTRVVKIFQGLYRTGLFGFFGLDLPFSSLFSGTNSQTFPGRVQFCDSHQLCHRLRRNLAHRFGEGRSHAIPSPQGRGSG